MSATQSSERSLALPNVSEPAEQLRNVGIADSDLVNQPVYSKTKSFLLWWPYVWGTCAAAILLQTPLLQSFALRALNRCDRLEDETAIRLNKEVSQRLEISAPALLVCEDSMTPFVAGLWSPKMVLPSDWGSWSNQQLTFVLLHELFHIKRRDILTQFMAKIAVAVYWFNPLSWWSFAHMMRLRELHRGASKVSCSSILDE